MGFDTIEINLVFYFFQDLSNSFKINAQGMRELCLKFDRDICVRWPWDLLENCWRYILEIFLRWVINKGMYFHFDLFEWNLAFSDANMIFQTPQTWTFCPTSADPPPPLKTRAPLSYYKLLGFENSQCRKG